MDDKGDKGGNGGKGDDFCKITFEWYSGGTPPQFLGKACTITGKFSWQDAVAKANQLPNWRMPTESEMTSAGLKMKGNDDICIYQKDEHPPSEYIWTSTVDPNNPGMVKGISLGDKGDDITTFSVNQSTALCRLVMVPSS